MRKLIFNLVLLSIISLTSCKKRFEQNYVNINKVESKEEVDVSFENSKTGYKDSVVVNSDEINLKVIIEEKEDTLRSFYSGHLKIKLPRDFNLMPENFIKVKYPTLNSSNAKIYCNNDGTISILLERSRRTLKHNELAQIKKQIEKSFNGIPEIDLEKVSIKKINRKDFVVVEFTSEALDARIYNLMFITDMNGLTFTGTFNCTVDYLKEWKPRAKEILNSIIVQ